MSSEKNATPGRPLFYIYRILPDYQKAGEKFNVPNSKPNLHYNSWKSVKKTLKAFNISIVNCNRDSHLDIFEFQSIDWCKGTKGSITKLASTPQKYLKNKSTQNTTYAINNSPTFNVFIVTTLDENSLSEYSRMTKSIQNNINAFLNLNIVALYGNSLTKKSYKELTKITTKALNMTKFDTYHYYNDMYGNKLYHPLGKFAKHFIARDFVAHYCNTDDIVIFLDPDVILQSDLSKFIKLLKKDKVLFGHEVELAHYAHKNNSRLHHAINFENDYSFYTTYFTEINTGVTLSYANKYCSLMNDFESFVKYSDYFKNLDSIPNGQKWHDQDFFRYFYRKKLRLDIGTFKLEHVFTTTKGGAKCLYYDVHSKTYKTMWDLKPLLIHFAGGTYDQIPNSDSLIYAFSKNNSSLLNTENILSYNNKNDEVCVSSGLIYSNFSNDDSQDCFTLKKHGIYLYSGSELLLKKWLDHISKDSYIILFVNENTDYRSIEIIEDFPQIKKTIVVPENGSSSTNNLDKFYYDVLPESLDSVVIPTGSKFKNLEFQPNIHIPDIRDQYPIFRLMWSIGIKHYALFSYSGIKFIYIPYLLDEFQNLHYNQRCFVVGNGPSLNQINMSLLKNEITFGSNRCYLGFNTWGFHFTYWGIMDRLQIEEYFHEYEKNVPSNIIKFYPFEYLPLLDFQNACPINFNYDGKPPYKFSSSPSELYIGFTVTHMLLQLAAIMGCNPIYLIGCDHRYNLSEKSNHNDVYGARNAKIWTAHDVSHSTHFTDQYIDTTKSDKKFITPKPDKAEEAFNVANQWAFNNNIKILNATPNTGLRSFPLINYDDIFRPTHTYHNYNKYIQTTVTDSIINYDGLFFIRGFTLGSRLIDRFEVYVNSYYIGNAAKHIERKDITIYSNYDTYSGFELLCILNNLIPASESLVYVLKIYDHHNHLIETITDNIKRISTIYDLANSGKLKEKSLYYDVLYNNNLQIIAYSKFDTFYEKVFISKNNHLLYYNDILNIQKQISDYVNYLYTYFKQQNVIIVSGHITQVKEKIKYFSELNAKLKTKGYELLVLEIKPKNTSKNTSHDLNSVNIPDFIYNIQNISEEAYAYLRNKHTDIFCANEYISNNTSHISENYILKLLCYKFFIQEIIKLLDVQLCILWHQFNSYHYIFSNICEDKDISYLYCEFGLLPGTIAFDVKGQMAESKVMINSNVFNSLDINQKDVDLAKKCLDFVRTKKLTRKTQDSKIDINQLGERAQKEGKKVIFYAGQNDWASGILPASISKSEIHSPLYSDTLHALEHLSYIAEKHNWIILFKPHPLATYNNLSDYYFNLKNVEYVEGANIFDCIKVSDACTTILSQAAYLILIHNKPCVLLGNIPLSITNCVWKPHTLDDVESCFSNAIAYGFTNQIEHCFLQHAAQLIKYYLYSFNDDIKTIIDKDTSVLSKDIVNYISHSDKSYFPIDIM